MTVISLERFAKRILIKVVSRDDIRRYPLTRISCLKVGQELQEAGIKTWTDNCTDVLLKKFERKFAGNISELISEGHRIATEKNS